MMGCQCNCQSVLSIINWSKNSWWKLLKAIRQARPFPWKYCGRNQPMFKCKHWIWLIQKTGTKRSHAIIEAFYFKNYCKHNLQCRIQAIGAYKIWFCTFDVSKAECSKWPIPNPNIINCGWNELRDCDVDWKRGVQNGMNTMTISSEIRYVI